MFPQHDPLASPQYADLVPDWAGRWRDFKIRWSCQQKHQIGLFTTKQTS
jgi:hypothetical protein